VWTITAKAAFSHCWHFCAGRSGGGNPPHRVIALCGAALVYGDAAITPAISVMSALEGLNIIAPHLERYLLPATVVILVALFAVQQQGTARIGRLLGPVMLIWFVIIALLGPWGITQHPAVAAPPCRVPPTPRAARPR